MLEEIFNLIFGLFAIFVLPGLIYEWVEKNFWKDSPTPRTTQSSRTTASQYCSPNELQRRLDAWMSAVEAAKGNNKWKFGRDYERYIGYLFESKGFHVIYNGAVEGRADGGIDLFCFKDGMVYLIQCKRWRNRVGCEAIEKFARAVKSFKNYRFLYENIIPACYSKVVPIFYSTSGYTDDAIELALEVRITFRTRTFRGIREYPPVKCTTKNSKKVYYLPFDRGFDEVCVGFSRGGCYKFTVFEAEKAGFRYVNNPDFVEPVKMPQMHQKVEHKEENNIVNYPALKRAELLASSL